MTIVVSREMGLLVCVFTMELRLPFWHRHGHLVLVVLVFCYNRNFFFNVLEIIVRMVLSLFRNNVFWILVFLVVLSFFRDDVLCILIFIKVVLLHHNGTIVVINFTSLFHFIHMNRKGLFIVCRVSRLVKNFLFVSAFFLLELFDDINCNWTKIIADKRHAALLLAGDKQRAAPTETVSIMLTGHSIATVNRAEDIARQDCWLLSLLYRLFLCLLLLLLLFFLFLFFFLLRHFVIFLG